MRQSTFAFVALLALGTANSSAADPAPVRAVVETTLATAEQQIRQFAFDGDPATFFASDKAPGKSDHFTLVFDKPVALTSVEVKTGRATGEEQLEGALEVSADGKKFEAVAQFADGIATAKSKSQMIRAIRVTPDAQLKHPVLIREFTIRSEPAVATFKHPVEFIIDVTDAPTMLEWAQKTARTCECQYDMICEALPSEGFKPRSTIRLTLKNDYRGVAATSGGRIVGSVKYFQDHPEDIGAMVHETVHCVQNYRTRNNPGWLVEGVADYIRFFKYEPGKVRRLSPDRAKYDASYRVSAAFLAFVSEKYDKDLVRKLNAAMRDGEYSADIWMGLTKKPLATLGDEWKESLR